MWYRTGTISLTNNSAVITGKDTKWAQAANGVMPGMIMIMPDNKFYEIKNVVSDTSLVLVTAYSGATAAAQAYAVITTYEGDLSQFSARFSALLTAMGGSRTDMYNWLTSTAATITISKDDGTTVPVKTLKAFTDEQASFAKKGINSDITSLTGLTTPLSVAQGGTGAKDAAGIRQNAGLGTLATLDVGTGKGQVPLTPGVNAGRHVSSYYLSQLTNAKLGGDGIGDEYMIIAAHPGATGISPTGFIGRITFSRGGVTASNGPGSYDCIVQTSYLASAPVLAMMTMDYTKAIFVSFHLATYKAKQFYVVKLNSSGGNCGNGAYFDGMLFETNDSNEIFSVVRASDLSGLTDISNAAPGRYLTTTNTTKASDGSIKAASPVARIANPDVTIRTDITENDFEWCGYGVANGEACGIEITREDVGVYRVKGAKSLSTSGWRLFPPRDPDGSGDLGVVTAEQDDEEIIIKLFRRKMVLADGEIVIQPGEPIDVPVNSWIDIRLDMPESVISHEQSQTE